MAPDGKLVFIDLGKPGTGLCIPPAKELYSPGYSAGARVSSNSWGNPYNGAGYYDSQDTDHYLYKRPVNYQHSNCCVCKIAAIFIYFLLQSHAELHDFLRRG